MYTKCPSCSAELSFLSPPNIESLPNGYKHRIRCPHCGVTISVPLKKAEEQPRVAEQQVVPITPALEVEDYEDSVHYKDKAKKSKRRGSVVRIFAVVIKKIIMALFICACISVVVGIAAFVLYMLSSSDKVALSLSMEGFADLFWVYGGVGIVAGTLLFCLHSMIHVRKKDDDDYKPQSSSTTSPNNTYSPHITMRPPNILDRVSGVFDHMIGRDSYADEYNRYLDSCGWCGRCSWYEAGDASGSVPGYCRYYSKTALWGDNACDHYE